MFTAEKVDARAARRSASSTRVPDDKLQDEAFALAKSMAKAPLSRCATMKDNLDERCMFDFSTARDHEAERLIACDDGDRERCRPHDSGKRV